MKILKNLLKCILAGIVAIAILCVVFAGYVFTPVHTPNTKGNTDYIWPAHARWSKMTEGISHGRFDAQGYNNLQVIENPDILILGSSHMEATDVQQDETIAHLLNQRFAGEYSAYNMGISGHNFIKICKYLPSTLQLSEEAPEYVIIETSQTLIQQSEVDALLEGTVEYTASHDTGLIATLQKLPFVRLMYHQLTGGLLDLFMPAEPTPPAQEPAAAQEEVYDALFAYIAEAMSHSNSKLIIFYHPTEILQEDGSVAFDVHKDGNALFAKKCEEYGITFVDMTQPFTDMYYEAHLLPHGFVTGKIGAGHLNAAGQASIARELGDTIERLKEAQ